MTSWPSAAWIDEAVSAASQLVGSESLSGSIEAVITGGAEGDVVVHIEFAQGRLTGAGLGAASPADVTLTLSDADAGAVLSGELDLNVAFMQGRLKVDGSMALVLDLLALAATDDARACRDQVAARTDG